MTPKDQFALAVNSLAVGMFLIVGATRHLDPPFVVLGMVCVGVFFQLNRLFNEVQTRSRNRLSFFIRKRFEGIE